MWVESGLTNPGDSQGTSQVNSLFFGAMQPIWRALAAVLLLAGVAACGGGVGPAQNVPNQSAIVILPNEEQRTNTGEIIFVPVVVYSGLPATFSITGGNGSYIVASNNQATVPSPGSFAGSSFTIVPNPVTTDTPVTLSARDTSGAPAVTLRLDVRTGTINNEITITPTSTQGGSCAPAICSGGDALVSVTLSQGGIPLAARGVRFDATSGDYRFIVTSPTGVETLATSATVATDETGRARARLRVTAGANNQTALLRVTDLGSLAYQQTSFTIAQATGSSPGFFAIPESIMFTGPRVDQCARGVSSNFFVYGGSPPYTISNTSSAFTVSPTIVGAAGGSFTVAAQGGCVDPGLPIGITDSSGRNISVTVGNKLGTAEVPALVVAPETITLSDCDTVANVTVAGGTGFYLQPASGSGSVIASIFGNTVAIRRLNPSGPTTSPVSIGISDGVSAKTVTLNLTGRALGACPSSGLTASPSAVTLTDCSSASVVTVSGGSGTYTATSSSSSVAATVSGGTVTIRRLDPSAALSGANVTITDGISSVVISVSVSGVGAGVCPSTSGALLTANPTSVTVTDCTTPRSVTLSGGSGSYSAQSSSAGIVANLTGSSLTIQRAVPSGAFAGGTVTVTDSAGAAVTVAVSAAGAGAGICSSGAALSANPTTVTLTDCTTARTVAISGGSGSYSVQADAGIVANLTGTSLSIQRAAAASFSSGNVRVTDSLGATVTIAVTGSGAGAGTCPTTAALSVNPASVTLEDCNVIRNVTVSGGSGTYSAVSGNASIEVTTSINIVSIKRRRPSEAIVVTPASVSVSDGLDTRAVSVAVTGAGAAACATP